MKRFLLEASQGKFKIYAFVQQLGQDLLVSIWGGTRPHLGAVGMATPRPSLEDPKKWSATSSIFTYIGHKEDVLVRPISEKLAAQWRGNVDRVSSSQFPPFLLLLFHPILMGIPGDGVYFRVVGMHRLFHEEESIPLFFESVQGQCSAQSHILKFILSDNDCDGFPGNTVDFDYGLRELVNQFSLLINVMLLHCIHLNNRHTFLLLRILFSPVSLPPNITIEVLVNALF